MMSPARKSLPMVARKQVKSSPSQWFKLRWTQGLDSLRPEQVVVLNGAPDEIESPHGTPA